MASITPVTSLPADGADPGASSRVIVSTATLRFVVSGKSAGVRNYRLIRQPKGETSAPWVPTDVVLQANGPDSDVEVVISSGLVQGEWYAVLADGAMPTPADLVFLAPVGAIVDSSAFYK